MQVAKVGDLAPPDLMVADHGELVSLQGFRNKLVVAYFYPKDDTPGCTRESCSFNEHLAELRKLGAEVIGISRDGTESHKRFKEKYSLGFPLLTDADAKLHKKLGAWGEKTSYGKTTVGVIRTTVIIDGSGHITHIFSPVKVDGHTEQVLKALREVSSSDA